MPNSKTEVREEPLVSVLVATYNQRAVVEETLNSIAAQSYKNIEIIISDDCSTDGTQDILVNFSKMSPNVTLFLQPKNLGITANYNFLAMKSFGKYVATFSGDDVMMNTKIAQQVDALEADGGASFCHHAVTVLDYDSGVQGNILTRKYVNNITTVHDVLRGLGIPGSMALMYCRSAADVPVFEPSIPTASDWLHIIKLAATGRGIYIPESLCLYRQDSNYNGKDPSTYENDFLKTIEIARSMYTLPGDDFDKSCDYAIRRYSLGAGYRSLIRSDMLKARSLFKTSMLEMKFVAPALILYAYSYLFSNIRILALVKKVLRF